MSAHVRRGASRLPVALLALTCWIGLMALSAGARAQEVEPSEFVPAPPGTNVVFGYYEYQHDTSYNIAGGSTYTKHTGVEVNVGVARYVHITPDVFGMHTGFQIYQIFGEESSAHVAGQRLGSTFGTQNTVISAFFWPYSNLKTGTNVNVTGFIYPPDGTYDHTSSVNFGDNRLRGDVQLGYDQQVGAHFSTTLSFDTTFYGQNSNFTVYGLNLNATPSYRFQAWANWRFTPAFQTSFGYEGIFGGIESVNGTRDGNRTEEQELRAAASLFLSLRSQIVLEVNHDIENTGGFHKEVGATARFLYAF